jgi:hypothetical protein
VDGNAAAASLIQLIIRRISAQWLSPLHNAISSAFRKKWHARTRAFTNAHSQPILAWKNPMPDRRGSRVDVDHNAIVTSIAEEMHYPVTIVKRIYEEEFVRLNAVARVTDFVVLLASRRTRDLLLSARRQRSSVTA